MSVEQFKSARKILWEATGEAWERNFSGFLKFANAENCYESEAARVLKLLDDFINNKIENYAVESIQDKGFLTGGNSSQILDELNRSANFGDQFSQPVYIASMTFMRSISGHTVKVKCSVVFSKLDKPLLKYANKSKGYSYNRQLSYLIL